MRDIRAHLRQLACSLPLLVLASSACEDPGSGPAPADAAIVDGREQGGSTVDAVGESGLPSSDGGDSAAGADAVDTDAGLPPGSVAPVKVSWESKFSLPPQDKDGWSRLKPSADSRLLYVSTSKGDDATAQTYTPASPEVGADPFDPKGPIKAFRDIDQALARARSGQPDWVLLRRGDTWTRTKRIDARSGRSAAERALIGAFGPLSDPRPLIKTGTASGVRFWANVRYVAVVGLGFYAHRRDPGSKDFIGFDKVTSASGFHSFASDAKTPNRTILVEDCVFRFYSNNTVQGSQPTEDFVVRRSQILWDYSTSSHSQGMYTKDASVLLEENLFDHNGWYKQSYVKLNDKAEGQATFFNHNTYFCNTHDTIFRRNLFLRASSIGNKFTANPPGKQDQVMVDNVLLDDNLYVEGEIGPGAGGNVDNGTGHRWRNMRFENNVLLDIGRGRPTDRTLAWGIGVSDWDGGRVVGNYFVHYGDAVVKNVNALKISGHTRDLEVAGNVFHGLESKHHAIAIDGAPKQNITVKDNQLQLGGTQMGLIEVAKLAPLSFSGNRYHTDRTPASSRFSIAGAGTDFTGWTKQSGESGATFQKLAYPEPGRTVESYMSSLGQPATLEAFIAEARKQRRGNWRAAYTAPAVNRYVRAGYAVAP